MLFLVACFLVGCIAYVMLSIWPVAILSTLVIVVGIVMSLIKSYGWAAFLQGFVLPVIVAQAGYVFSILLETVIRSFQSKLRLGAKQDSQQISKNKLI